MRKSGWKSALTKQRLAAAAEESFATLGYEKTGLREVAAAVGVNPALVKRYFGSKEGLFEEAFAGVLKFENGIPANRDDFGTHMADLLTTQSINTLPILLHAGSVPEIKSKALQMHREKILVPSGANVEGKAQGFMVYVGGFDRYTKQCASVLDNGYEGFMRT